MARMFAECEFTHPLILHLQRMAAPAKRVRLLELQTRIALQQEPTFRQTYIRVSFCGAEVDSEPNVDVAPISKHAVACDRSIHPIGNTHCLAGVIADTEFGYCEFGNVETVKKGSEKERVRPLIAKLCKTGHAVRR